MHYNFGNFPGRGGVVDGLLYVMGQLVGMLIAAGVTIAAIYLVRGPLARFLAAIIEDETVVQLGVSFVVLLFGLRGLSTILNYISQPALNAILRELSTLLSQLAADVQWAGQVAALLFIGYALTRSWRAPLVEADEAVEGPPALETVEDAE